MQVCGQCNSYNSDESIFCGHCGNRLNNNCPVCGYRNLWEQRFCGDCGKQLQPDTELEATAPAYTRLQIKPEPSGEATSPPAELQPEPAAVASQAPEASVADLTMEKTAPGMSQAPTETIRVTSPEPTPSVQVDQSAPYALVSLELVDWEQNASADADVEWLDTFRQQCSNYLQRRILAAGGDLRARKRHVLFVAFKNNDALQDPLHSSLVHAIDVCLALLTEDLRCPWGSFKLRIGLDIEYPDNRNPLISTPERAVGLPGTLTVSHGVFQEVGEVYQTEQIGPVRMGNQVLTFYRVVGGRQPLEEELPLREEALPPATGNDSGSFEVRHDVSETVAAFSQPVENVESYSERVSFDPIDSEKRSSPRTGFGDPSIGSKDTLYSEPETPILDGIPPEAPLEEPSPWQDAPQEEQEARWEEDHPPSQPSAPEMAGFSEPIDFVGEHAVSPAEDLSRMAEDITAPSPTESDFSEALWATAQQDETPSAETEPPAQSHPAGPVEESPDEHDGYRPELEPYEPPTPARRAEPRADNIRYYDVREALVSELESFLSSASNGEANGIKGCVLSLCAPDGLGKSSLIHMARNHLDPDNVRAAWLGANHYRSFQQTSLPLTYWLELIRNLLSLPPEGQPVQEVRERLEHFLNYVYEGEAPGAMLAFMRDLLSVEPPRPISADAHANVGRIEALLMDFFRLLSSKRPLIIVLEDLTFADPASLDLLTRLLERKPAGLPICFILTQTADWWPEGALADALQKMPFKEWVIAPLNDAETLRLLNEGPLGGTLDRFPPALIALIVRGCQGLPLYLEESMRLLHLRGVLTMDPQSGQFTPPPHFDPAEQSIPHALPELIAERLAFLDADSLYVLRMASVLGEKFSVSVLAALAQMEEGLLNACLGTLFSHGFLLPDIAQMGRFRHGLIRDIIYAGIEPSIRLQMHQLISETLENDFNQGLTVPPMLIAHHSECGRLSNRALHYWNLTGIHAGVIGSLIGMNMAMFRALALLRESQPEPLENQELALRIAESLGVVNLEEDPDRAVNLLEWVCFHGQRVFGNDAARLVEPLGFLALAHENRGDIENALSALEMAVELVDANSHPQEAASLQINRMDYLVTLGRMQQARQLMEGEIEPLVQAPDFTGGDPTLEEVRLRAGLLKIQVLTAQCDTGTEALLENTLRQARERKLDMVEIALRLAQSQFFVRSGRYQACNEAADALLNDIEAMADSDWFLAQWGLLAMLYHCETADWSSASQLVLTVISKAESVRDYHTWILAQAYAGYIEGKQGRLHEARQLLEQSIGLSSEHRFASVALTGWRLLAEFEADCGNLEVAEEIASRALEVAGKPDIQNRYEAFRLTMTLVRALLAKEKNREAGRLLEPLWPEISATRWTPLVAECAFEIARLHKQLAQGAPPDLSRKYLERSMSFFQKAKELWLELGLAGHAQQVDAVMAPFGA